jgi:hypothetical protein
LAQTRIRRLIENASEDILKTQLEHAKRGNPLVARFLLERIIPAARATAVSSPLRLDGLSPGEQAEAVRNALAGGSLTTEEAGALLDAIRLTQEIRDNGEQRARIVELETKLAALTGGSAPALSAPAAALPAPETDGNDQ